MRRHLSILLLFAGSNLMAQPLASASLETPKIIEPIDSITENIAEVVEVKYVDHLAFDIALIPCSDLYDYSWDSLNLDQPKVQPGDTSVAVKLALIESECAYHHPCNGPYN